MPLLIKGVENDANRRLEDKFAVFIDFGYFSKISNIFLLSHNLSLVSSKWSECDCESNEGSLAYTAKISMIISGQERVKKEKSWSILCSPQTWPPLLLSCLLCTSSGLWNFLQSWQLFDLICDPLSTLKCKYDPVRQ